MATPPPSPIRTRRSAGAIAAATSTRFGVGGSAFRTGGGEQPTDALPFGTFRRSVFSRFGLFDERLVRNQDIEFYGRVRRGGGRVMLSPSIRLTYLTRATYGGIRQQAFYNGLWNPYTRYLTGGGPHLRHFVPLVFVLSLLVAYGGGHVLVACLGLVGGGTAALRRPRRSRKRFAPPHALARPPSLYSWPSSSFTSRTASGSSAACWQPPGSSACCASHTSHPSRSNGTAESTPARMGRLSQLASRWAGRGCPRPRRRRARLWSPRRPPHRLRRPRP